MYAKLLVEALFDAQGAQSPAKPRQTHWAFEIKDDQTQPITASRCTAYCTFGLCTSSCTLDTNHIPAFQHRCGNGHQWW